jgi:hypothetical protein
MLSTQKTEAIFWTAKGEEFEDGMESRFSRKLSYFVKRNMAQMHWSNNLFDCV